MTEGPPSAPPLQLSRPDSVRLLGREWSRAGKAERVALGVLAFLGAVVLALAVWLDPDPSGYGTHEQLGLPACGFTEFMDGPCPSCGYTTTFALAMEGRLLEACQNQPFGFLVFLCTLVAVPILSLASCRGASLLDRIDPWPWGKILLGVFALWILAWGYKWYQWAP